MRRDAVVPFVIALFWHVPALACTCGPSSPTESFARNAAVFAGYMVGSYEAKTGPLGGIVYRFVVTHVWKGDVGNDARVITPHDGAACGYKFKPREHYLVYGDTYGWGRQLRTGLCSRTGPLDTAVWDRFVLGAPRQSWSDAQIPLLSFEDLAEILADADSRSRYSAASALASLEESRDAVIRIFREVIRGERPGDPCTAVFCLREIREDARALIPDLLWVWERGSGEVRNAVLHSMLAIAIPDEWYPLLTEALLDAALPWRSNFVAGAAQWAKRLEPERSDVIFGIVFDLLRDRDSEIRRAAVGAMPGFDEQGSFAIPWLERMKRSDPDDGVRRAAEFALRQMEREALR